MKLTVLLQCSVSARDRFMARSLCSWCFVSACAIVCKGLRLIALLYWRIRIFQTINMDHLCPATGTTQLKEQHTISHKPIKGNTSNSLGFPIKLLQPISPLRTLVSPSGMDRNQRWEVNKCPLKNIGSLVKTHSHSRAATLHMSTHSLPISFTLVPPSCLMKKRGLQSQQAKHRSVLPECCFPFGQTSHCPPSNVIRFHYNSHSMNELPTANNNTQVRGRRAGPLRDPLWTKLDCLYGPQMFEKWRKTMEQKINTLKPQWWLHLVN